MIGDINEILFVVQRTAGLKHGERVYIQEMRHRTEVEFLSTWSPKWVVEPPDCVERIILWTNNQKSKYSLNESVGSWKKISVLELSTEIYMLWKKVPVNDGRVWHWWRIDWPLDNEIFSQINEVGRKEQKRMWMYIILILTTEKYEHNVPFGK